VKKHVAEAKDRIDWIVYIITPRIEVISGIIVSSK
jgi:hypothetical protein